MQTGIARSLLSNRKRTFSQLLRIYFTKKISNGNSNSFPNPTQKPSFSPTHFTQAPSFPTVLESHGAKNPNAETFPKYSNAISWAWPNNLVCAFRLHLFQCKVFFGCKIFLGENIFGKGKYFLVFGCILKIILENNFQCLVTFWKYYFPTKFSHFLNFQTNFISQNPPPPPPTHQHPQKIHHYPHKTHHHTTQKLPKQHHPHHHKKIKK